jgi:hypothetical protein
MVSLEQYRITIGTFSGNTRESNIGSKCVAIEGNVYLMVFAISMLLLLAGDVETNPGPSRNQLILAKLDKLKAFLSEPKKAVLVPNSSQKQILKNIAKTLEIINEKKIIKVDSNAKRRLEKVRLLQISHETFKPNLHELTVDPIGDEHKVYKDKDIQVYIKRVKFAKQRNFAMLDYQYQVKVKQSNNASPAPLFKDVADNLHLALTKLVKELQQQLDPKKHSQIYFCFIHPDLAANIFTGNYPLYPTNSEKITDEVFQRLASTLRSFQHIALDSSFEIRIKILSVDHIAQKLQKGSLKWKNIVGVKTKRLSYHNILSNETLKSMITIPDNVRFKNKCLPAAVLLGFYFSRYCKNRYDKNIAKEDAKIYTSIKRINQQITREMRLNHSIRAQQTLLCLIGEFVAKLGYKSQGPYEMTEFLQKSSDLLNVRFHVFSNQGNRRCFVYPVEFDHKMPQIYLYNEIGESRCQNNVTHMSLITNINSFMKHSGYPCLYCNKIRYSFYHHCAKKGVCCFSCRRINLTDPCTYVDSNNKRTFCFKLPTTNRERIVCNDCNITIQTRECAKKHKGNIKVCQKGFYCNNCRSFNLRPNKNISIKQLKEKHKCDEELCRLCFDYFSVDENHLCKMRSQGPQNYMKNLAFFDLESFTGTDSQACSHCYEIEQVYILQHQDTVRKLTELRDLLVEIVASTRDRLSEQEFFSHIFNNNNFDEDYVFSMLGSIDVSIYKKYFTDKDWCTVLLKRSEVSKLIQMSVLEAGRARCGIHLDRIETDDTVHIPNYAVLYYESETHGKFNRIDFADKAMEHENDCCILPSVYETSYLPDFIDNMVKTKKVRGMKTQTSGSVTKFPLIVKTVNNSNQRVEQAAEAMEDVESNDFINYDCDVEMDSEYEDMSGDDDEGEVPLGENPNKRNIPMFGHMPDLESIKSFPVIDKLLLFICNESFRNYVFISHNGSAYDMQFICEACYRHGIAPKMITRDMRILQLTITQFNITFLDSIQYVSGSLDSLTKTFHLEAEKGFFPHGFNLPENYNYDGSCPPVECFESFNDSEEMLLKKAKFVNQLVFTRYNWNFKNEIAMYCNQDVKVLCQAMCLFLKQSITFQLELIVRLDKENQLGKPPIPEIKQSIPFLHPFTTPFLTLSGWVFGVWRKLFLPMYKIYSLKDEKGLTSIEVSAAEREYVLYKQWKNPKLKIFSTYTSEKPARFGNYIPDYYIPQLSEVGWMHGCYWHAHRIQDGCKDRGQKWADEGTTNFVGNSFAGEQFSFKKQQHYLKATCGIQYSNQKVMWTCQWKALKTFPLENLLPREREEALEVRKFMAHFYDNRPAERLAPRTGLRGGKVESFIFKWRKEDNPKKTLHYYDYNSLYPSVSSNKKNPFPVGKPTIYITPEQIETIQFDKKSAYIIKAEKKVRVKGVGQAKVIPPVALIPFLQYRIKQKYAEKTISAMCRTCAEKSLQKPCQHSDNERAFVSVWTLDELAYAKSIGYKLVQIYEAYVYEETQPIFSTFLETLAKYKVT